MDFLERYDWLFFLALLFAATLILWIRDIRRARSNPAIGKRYGKRALKFLFWAALPWAVIGIGILTGQLENSDDAFNLGLVAFVIANTR